MRILVFGNLTLLLLSMSMVAGCNTLKQSKKDATYGVTITGVQHLGKDYSIPEFYVDDYSGGNVGRGGGGGSYACCVMMPEKWHNGLNVVVRWTVSNWKNADYNEIAREDYSTIKVDGSYVATVPIEEYGELGDLYVHFFSGGRVRVVVSMYGASGKGHPISRESNEEEKAAKGTLVNRMVGKSQHKGD